MTKDSASGTPRGAARSSASLLSRMGRVMAWSVAGLLVVVLLLGIYAVWPIFFPGPTGVSGQQPVTGYPTMVSATGDDGRTRTLSVTGEDGAEIDLSAVEPGERVVVNGSGFNPKQGVYVAVCKIPDAPTTRPGPCLGGVPNTEVSEDEGGQGDDGSRPAEWAPANWINDDWAWKLFGARGFDDRELGTFTAYIDIPAAADDYVDCAREECGLFTRNDHTALDNRMQDLYLRVTFTR